MVYSQDYKPVLSVKEGGGGGGGIIAQLFEITANISESISY